MSPKRKNHKKTKQQQSVFKQEISGIILIAIAILLFISLLIPDAGSVGAVGLFFTGVMKALAGKANFVLPFFVFLIGILIFTDRQSDLWFKRFTGLNLIFVSLVSFLHLSLDLLPFKEYMTLAIKGGGGGFLGGIFSFILRSTIGQIGAIVFLTALSIIGIMVFTQVSIWALLKKLGTLITGLFAWMKRENVDKGKSVREKDKKEQPFKDRTNDRTPFIISHNEDFPDVPLVDEKKDDIPVFDPPVLNKFAKEYLPTLSGKDRNKETSHDDNQEKTITEDLSNENESLIPLDSLNYDESQDGQNTEYCLPSPDLISMGVKIKSTRMKKELADSAAVLEDTLETFGVAAKVINVVDGPAVTRYELQPAPGVKVSRITNLTDDIALALAASSVRIEAPIPGKGLVGIEVPRDKMATVFFKEVISSEEFKASPSLLSFALGKTIGGDIIVGDLGKMPHLLIAGATGAGKSISINCMICSLLFKARPDQLKLILIDPKKVELANYNGLPHLLTPVVSDSKKAAGCLKWAVIEMENRYSLFASAGVKDFDTYNKGQTEVPLPKIVIIIDELADLMLVAPSDVEESIYRLAQMARAAGIHLVVATQRPSVNVITGVIKANIPSRIAFAVSSYTDSRTILDMGGAEKLLGKGDMLFHPIGASKPMRVQGTFIEEKDIKTLVEFCREQTAPQFYEESVFAQSVNEKKNESLDDEDNLLYEAARLIIETGQASTSFLQRRLRIGNPRAGRLIDILEAKGVVSGPDGAKPRNVLMTIDEFEERYGKRA